ncbi:MAG: PEP-CTERM sorting domain-containing protein [Alphaproteobacteria bacterium]|nr:PEP-CTERM sorting domain-containing protein [Alphaproteobacteria bacterium]
MSRSLCGVSARILSVAAVAAAAIFAGVLATPAYAIVVPWSGAGSGGTPDLDGQPFLPPPALGDTWQLVNSNTTWQIQLNSGATPSIFNQTLFSNSFGTFATAFQFTINSGVAGIGSAQLVDVTTGKTWASSLSLGSPAQRATLDAPAGTQLGALDQYTLDINFTGAADPGTFSFAALWSDSPISSSVPEPATWSLFGAAALALVMMRRRGFAAI